MDERQKAIDTVIKNMEKSFGKGAVMKLGDDVGRKVSTVSSGSITLDKALGVGGYPKGRIIEIYGPESSGKTTVALHAIAEAQRNGGIAAFIDAEHALDPDYAKNLGVDIENLYLSQPDTGEQALEITEAFVRSGAVDIVVVDSVAALTPKAEIEGEMGDAHVGLRRGSCPRHSGSSPVRFPKVIRQPCSSTRSVKKSVSCSVIRKRHPAAVRSSSTAPCVLKSDVPSS